MKKNQSLVLDVGIILVIYFVFLLVQTHSVGRAAFSFTDEGVYLYAAKLITQGYVPYRDFFLGHFPFLIYANAAIMLTVKSNMIVYHWVYTAWTLSLVIPLYFTIKKLTENRSAAVLSLVVLAGFTEMMQWDMHYFAIRQASLPFLAWALLFLTYRKLTPTAFLLALFSICLATNIVLSVALVASYLLLEYVFNRKKLNFREFVVPALMFLVIVGSQFLILWLIPNGIKNVLGFQIDRGSVGLLGRFSEIIEVIPKNWPIFLFGLAGIFRLQEKYGLSGGL